MLAIRALPLLLDLRPLPNPSPPREASRPRRATRLLPTSVSRTTPSLQVGTKRSAKLESGRSSPLHHHHRLRPTLAPTTAHSTAIQVDRFANGRKKKKTTNLATSSSSARSASRTLEGVRTKTCRPSSLRRPVRPGRLRSSRRSRARWTLDRRLSSLWARRAQGERKRGTSSPL